MISLSFISRNFETFKKFHNNINNRNKKKLGKVKAKGTNHYYRKKVNMKFKQKNYR